MKRRMRPEDLLRLRWAGEVAIEPSGLAVVYVESRMHGQDNRYRRRLVRVRAGEAAEPLTQGEHDHAPAWSPDGRGLAFLRHEGEEAQIWLLPAAGGEARALTSVAGGIGAFAWSPDGRHIAAVAHLDGRGVVARAEGEPSGAGEARPGAAVGGLPGDSDDLETLYERHNRDVRITDELFYKLDGEGYFTARRGQLVVLDVARALALEEGRTAALRQLTFGPYRHAGAVWSGDGRTLYCLSDHRPDHDREPWRKAVYRVPIDGGEAVQVSPLGAVSISDLAVRPDGAEIAYVLHRREDAGYDNGELWLQGGNGGVPRRVAAQLDRPFGVHLAADVLGGGRSGLGYAPDGRSLLTTVSDEGRVHLVRIDAETGAVTRLGSDEDVSVAAYAVDRAGRYVATIRTSPSMPGDVYRLDLEGGTVERLTDLNRTLFDEVALSEPERFTAIAPDGTAVGGWVMRPYGFTAEGRYPTALEIHGGPVGMYGQAYMHEFQVLAAAGYAVVYGNPRGSTGYGKAFCEAIRFRWGERDYMDVMALVDAAIARYAWIDADRLGVLGGSYGGYMTNWVVGHTDRFKAAVTMRSVVEWGALMGTGDLGPEWPERPGGEPPWRDDDWYRQQSPLTYVDNIVTPLLIEHQEGDLRCPVEQGEMLYTAVRFLGRAPVRFVRYPGEFHGMSRSGQPMHRVHRLRQILDWFGRYLGGDAPALTVVDRTYRERAGAAPARD